MSKSGIDDPFGVQKALEQQRIAQGIKVGDRQRIGHQRTRARPPPRTHRNAALLRPLDEVGDDQEVAREAHLFDDSQFKIQPRLVDLARRRRRDHRQPRRQPRARLSAQLLDLVLREFRQDRPALVRREGAAPRDLDRHRQRLRQVREQRRHFGLGLQPVLRRQAAAGFLLVDIGPFRDADQRVMRFVQVRHREIHVVCRHDRQPVAVGDADEDRLGHRLGLGQAAVARMPLQFHVEPTGIDRRQLCHQRLGPCPLACADQPPRRTVRPACQADQPLSMGRDLAQRHLRQLPALADIQAAVQLQQVRIARRVLRQQNNRCRGPLPVALRHRIEGQVDLTSDDRLDALVPRQRREFQRREQVVRVRHRDGGRARLFGQHDQLLHLHRALQKRVFRMDAQMDESGGCRHDPTLAGPCAHCHAPRDADAPQR